MVRCWENVHGQDDWKVNLLADGIMEHLQDRSMVLEALAEGSESGPDPSGAAESVYIFMYSGGDWIKVGVSYNPELRLRELQVACPLRIDYLKGWSLPASKWDLPAPKKGLPVQRARPALDLEQAIHKALAALEFEQGAGREWFRAPFDITAWAIDRVVGRARGVFCG